MTPRVPQWLKRRLATLCSRPLYHLLLPPVRRRGLDGTAVLVYHEASRDRFAAHVRYLQEHYTVLPLEEVVERHRRGDVPDDAVVITFDDGYRSLHSEVLPVVEKLAVPVSVFLPTGYVDTDEAFWWDRAQAARDAGADLPSKRALKRLDERDRRALIDEAVVAHDCEPEERTVLDADEVSDLESTGHVTFHSHSRTHPILPTQDLATAREEIAGSRADLRELCEDPGDVFAYPDGRYEPEHAELVEEAGYDAAVTIRPGLVDDDGDPYALNRITWCGMPGGGQGTRSFRAAPLPVMAVALHGLFRKLSGKQFED